jgi:hypothetical protein
MLSIVVSLEVLSKRALVALQEYHDIEGCVRNASIATLPPSYDIAVSMPLMSTNVQEEVKDGRVGAVVGAMPGDELPSYDEALRLLTQNQTPTG